jgi:hypothetical protein
MVFLSDGTLTRKMQNARPDCNSGAEGLSRGGGALPGYRIPKITGIFDASFDGRQI